MTRLEARKEALEICITVLRRMAFDNPANLDSPTDIQMLKEEMNKIADFLQIQEYRVVEEKMFLNFCENFERFEAQ
jgi:hypothetical protein